MGTELWFLKKLRWVLASAAANLISWSTVASDSMTRETGCHLGRFLSRVPGSICAWDHLGALRTTDSWDTWLTHSVEHVTLDHGGISLSLMLGIEINLKNKI